MTVHFLEDLERILTSHPASPPLAPLSSIEPCLAWEAWATWKVYGGSWSSQECWWNPGDMVPGRPDMTAEPDPNPQSCDTDCSQIENGVIRDV